MLDAIMPDLHIGRIPHASPVQASQFERVLDKGMNGVPIFDMEKVDASAEDAALEILFNTVPQPRMEAPQAFLEIGEELGVDLLMALAMRSRGQRLGNSRSHFKPV